jgi:hypothetical protein
VWAEFRGYCVTLLELQRQGVPVGDEDLQWLRKQFCGWSYYKMSWTWTPLEKAFRKIVDSPSSSADTELLPYADTRESK